MSERVTYAIEQRLQGWTQQTYQATRLHSECMDVLRKLLSDLQELAEEEASGIIRFTN